jgi:hypothetical protein
MLDVDELLDGEVRLGLSEGASNQRGSHDE